MNLPTMLDGRLYKYSSVGSYPLFYLDSNDTVLCRDCAEQSLDSDFKEDRPIFCGVNWEEQSLYCGCGEWIESAYPP